MPVCITGMHRSGTSMVAKLLKESGLYLGPDADLMAAAVENPEGFWENLKIVEINEELLNQLGGGWDCPPPIPPAWTGGRLAPLVSRAEALVAEFAGREPWGWKDPRTSLTLPFWQAILGRLRVVVVVRNPLEVARSLRERNGFSYALGLTLWRIAYQRLLDAVPATDRVVTHYDAYFAAAKTEVRRVLTLLELPVAPEVIERFQAGDPARLRHHRFTARDLVNADVSPEVRDLYLALCDEAEWRDGDTVAPAGDARAASGPGLGAASTLEIGVGRVNRFTVEAEVIRQELDELRREYHRAVGERDERIDELKQTLNEREAVIRERRAVEREVTALRQTVADQAAHIDLLDARLETMTAYEQELRGLLVGAQEQILHRDAEVMATLGAALARHAPQAPAAIYYRQLLQAVREKVAANIPAAVPVAVISAGDDAMLQLDGRQAWHFPPAEGGLTTDYTSIDGPLAITQLELLRSRGAGYLVAPASATSWLARYPDLAGYLEQRYPAVVRDEGTCTIYDLRQPAAASAA